MIDKLKDKPWILDLVEGAAYYTIAAFIVYGGWWLNNKIENKTNDTIEMFKEVDRKSNYNTRENRELSNGMKDMELKMHEYIIRTETNNEMIKKEIKYLNKKTASYNLSFIVKNGDKKKEVRIKNLNNEYMGQLFDDMDTIYNTVNENGNFKINNKIRLYGIENKLKSIDELGKLKFKDLESYVNPTIKSGSNLISELSIEMAE